MLLPILRQIEQKGHDPIAGPSYLRMAWRTAML
jgi:hypothetical protein